MKKAAGICFVNPNPRPRDVLVRNYPPLGVMHLAGACRERGLPYAFVDADADDLGDQQVIGQVMRHQMPVVGLPLVSLNSGPTLALINRLTERTACKVIVGGPMAASDTEYLFQACPGIAAAVTGEGEQVTPLLVERLSARRAIDDLPGIAFRRGEGLCRMPPGSPLPGELVARPDFSMVDYAKYQGCFPVGMVPSASLMVTRGCPYQCGFCSNPIWNHAPRPVPPQTVVAWVEDLRRLGVRELFFVDDTFNCDPAWFRAVCTGLIDSGLSGQMGFKAPFRADLATDDQLDLARRAGFWMIFYGFESGSPEVLKYYRKGERPEDLVRAIRQTRLAGISSLASTIFGCPVDSRRTARETMEVLCQSDPDYAPINVVIPYVGTPLSRDMVQRGWLSQDEVRHYDYRRPRIRTETLTTEEVLDCVEEMRQDFRRFKQSPQRFARRVGELKAMSVPVPESAAAWESRNYDSPVLPLASQDRRIEMLLEVLVCGSQDIRVKGLCWHQPENLGGVEFRWSAGQVDLPFMLRQPRRRMTLSFAVFRPDTPHLHLRLEGPCGEQLAALEHAAAPGPWRQLDWDLPRAVSGIVWLRLRVDPVYVPSDRSSNPDSRELGIAVREMRFSEGPKR